MKSILKFLLKSAKIFTMNIIIFEILLNLFSYSFYFFEHQKMNNHRKKIVALGESTTASMNGKFDAWPTVLQKKIDEHKLNYQVINLAIPGTNSTSQVFALLDQYDKIRPEVVISMMGVNDTPFLSLANNFELKKNNRYLDIKVFKMVKTVFNLIKKSIQIIKQKSIYRKMNKFNLSSQINPSICELNLDQLNTQYTKDELAFLFFNIAQNNNKVWSLNRMDNVGGLQCYQKAFEYNPTELKYAELLTLKLDFNRQNCDYVFKMVNSLDDYEFSDVLIERLSRCVDREKNEFYIFMQKKFPQYVFTANSFEKPTSKNYQKLFNFLKSKNTCYFAMQYPNRNINLIKSYYAEEEISDGKIIFIENKNNFLIKMNEQKISYSDLFYDQFAADFGHTTSLGSELIAENVFEYILNFDTNKICH